VVERRTFATIYENEQFSATDREAADCEQENICWTIAGLSSANEVFGCK
jgi:hypothetical protein